MNRIFTKFTILVILALVLPTEQLPEIKMLHKRRTPREEKMLVEYMSRGPLLAKVNALLSRIFPSNLTPNIYAYPEVKIINYLDAQYYG